MAVWQLFAAGAAVALTARGVLRIARIRRRTEIVAVLLMIPVPVMGFLFYAVAPGGMPELSLLTLLAIGLMVIGFYPVFISRSAIQALTSGTVNASDATKANRYVLAARACQALGISAFVAVFEPSFGIANLVLLMAWVVAWIPKRLRRQSYEATADIAAPPASVFAFLVEPSNWTVYQVDLESVVVSPPGPLGVGSEITTRRKFAQNGPITKSMPTLLESRAVITSMLPGISFTAVGSYGSTAMTEVRQSRTGTRLTLRQKGMTPFTSAVLGLALEAPLTLAVRRQTTLRSLERLGQELSAPAAGPPGK